jgi:hypothetical protein
MSPARMTLTRAQLIAAEVFGCSFHNYEDHLVSAICATNS